MKGEIRAINSTGDTKVEWDSGNAAEVAQAKKSFAEYIRNGFTAYKGRQQGRGQKISVFDPEAEFIVMVPPAVGG